jgi:hypothetical protein
MKKTKRITKKAGRYLRDFSIVVAGIAVTLYVNSWVTNQSEKRDTVCYLNALKLEMEENTEIINNMITMFEDAECYVHYISSHDRKSLNRDSLKNYKEIYYQLYSYTPMTSAFEMFKSSGSMRFIDNKETLQSIWHVYSDIENLKKNIDYYYQQKEKEREKDLQYWRETGKPVDVPMYNFYWMEMEGGMKATCQIRLRAIENVLSKLNEIIP